MLCSFSDIEAQILEIQGMKATLLEEGEQGVGLDSTGFFDQEIYGGSDSRFTGYVTSIAANEQEDVWHLFIDIITFSVNNCQHSFIYQIVVFAKMNTTWNLIQHSSYFL